jgi:hypothetical protein
MSTEPQDNAAIMALIESLFADLPKDDQEMLLWQLQLRINRQLDPEPSKHPAMRTYRPPKPQVKRSNRIRHTTTEEKFEQALVEAMLRKVRKDGCTCNPEITPAGSSLPTDIKHENDCPLADE